MFIVGYWSYAIGTAVLKATLVTYRDAVRALLRGDFGYFTRIEGSGPLTVLVTIAALYIMVTFLFLGMGIGEMIQTAALLWVYLIYVLGAIGLAVIALGAAIFAIDIAREHRLAYADHETDVSTTTGLWLLVAGLVIHAGTFVVAAVSPTAGEIMTVDQMLVGAGGLLAMVVTPAGVFLDSRRTGLYAVFGIRYVVTLASALPILGAVPAVVYLGRRQLRAWTGV